MRLTNKRPETINFEGASGRQEPIENYYHHFARIGKGKASIGYCHRSGTASMDQATGKGWMSRTALLPDEICVVLIRDVIDKWKSGLYAEMMSLDSLISTEKVPTIKGMVDDHARFWNWNDENDLSLIELSLYENIYFLELKDLSNPKFLKWLQEKEEKWKEVKEIGHLNKNEGAGIKALTVCELFWKSFNDKFPVLNLMIKQQQEQIDFIRENHKRYIRL